MNLRGLKLHFMGIGGIGVSALAEIARAEGAVVSGCDHEESSITRRLRREGIEIFNCHAAEHAVGQDLLVYSSAIPQSHPERVAAGKRQEKRGAFLARLMENRCGVGVSGTHGKTTTSWLLAHLLIESGDDPYVFIGGIAPALEHGNFRIGSGRFVAELDESDESFLLPRLNVAIATNLESDHLSHYRDFAALKKAFQKYSAGVAKDGLFIAGIDSPDLADIFAGHQGRKLSFGLTPEANVRAEDIREHGAESSFDLVYHENNFGRFTLSMPGKHNILNALAALGAALELGAGIDNLRQALPSVRGVGRRLEYLGRVGAAEVYSDYAHHPTEVAATIDAIRQVKGGKTLIVFQPHLYSRTRDYAHDFGVSLATADAVLLVDIYPAREDPLPGVTSELLLAPAKAINPDIHGPVPLAEVASRVREMAGRFDAVVMMGAGNIDAVAREMTE